jgi:hypothetical protein
MVTNVAPALQPTIASTPGPRHTVPPRATETRDESSGKNVVNGALVLGALVFLICALTAAAYTESIVFVIGGVGCALALILIRIFR